VIKPALAETLAAFNNGGYWALALDAEWRLRAMTDEFAAAAGTDYVLGAFHFGPEAVDRRLEGSAGFNALDDNREWLRRVGGWVLADFGDREALRERLHPALRDLVDHLEPSDSTSVAWNTPTTYLGAAIGTHSLVLRVRDSGGKAVGTVIVTKPAVGMNTIAMLSAEGDLDHLQRMRGLAKAGRRPAAVLFADLEGSAQLSKRMPTAAYFTLVRRMTRAADQCVVDAGGLVGRHVGDGVAAFFVAETAESESAAARACISAARSLQEAMWQIAERHELLPADVTVRAGLHWGATLYVGSIITSGRTEVTALGDEVNEAARIEACATNGRVLASKDLIERLNAVDAKTLGIELDRVTYTQLTDLDTATDKARRDAPSVPVCDIARAQPERL
jgi:class 3 adenylate cyclase